MSTMTVKHPFVSSQPEGSDPNKVRTSNWNAAHQLTGVGLELDRNVAANWTLSTPKNTLSAGPITVDEGVVVTVSSGAEWKIV